MSSTDTTVMTPPGTSTPGHMEDSMKDHTMSSEAPLIGHQMPIDDPDNPLNWPLHRRLYATASSSGFAFAVYDRSSLEPDQVY